MVYHNCTLFLTTSVYAGGVTTGDTAAGHCTQSQGGFRVSWPTTYPSSQKKKETERILRLIIYNGLTAKDREHQLTQQQCRTKLTTKNGNELSGQQQQQQRVLRGGGGGLGVQTNKGKKKRDEIG
jgi:hypothetical protein